MDNARLQRDKKKGVKEKEEFARLFAAKTAKRKNSVVLEQLKKNVLTVTMKVSEQIGTLVASLK